MIITDYVIVVILIFFQWLEDHFLKYLSDWEEYVESHTELSADAKKMMLSRETLEGLKITGETAS